MPGPATMTIGTVDIDMMHGVVAKPVDVVETWEVPGLNGYGAQKLGKRGDPSQIVTVNYCTDNTAANTFIDSCLAMQATVTNMTDPWTDVPQKILISKVTYSKQPMIWDDHQNGVRVEVHWTMMFATDQTSL